MVPVYNAASAPLLIMQCVRQEQDTAWRLSQFFKIVFMLIDKILMILIFLVDATIITCDLNLLYVLQNI